MSAPRHIVDLPTDWRERGMFTLDEDGTLIVNTNQGLATCYVGWFIIFGTAAEFYPVPPAIFHGRWELDTEAVA